MFSFLTKSTLVNNKNTTHSNELTSQERFTQLENEFLSKMGIDASKNSLLMNSKEESVTKPAETQKFIKPFVALEKNIKPAEEDCPPPVPVFMEEIDRAEAEILLFKNDNKSIQQSSSELDQVMLQRTTYYEGLKNRLDGLNQERKNLKDEVKNKNSILGQRENDIKELMNKIAQCQHQSEQFAKEILLTEKRIKTVENEVLSYQQQYVKLAQDVESLCQKYYENEEYLESQKAILNLKKSRTENLEKTKTLFKKSLPQSSPIRKEVPQSIN